MSMFNDRNDGLDFWHFIFHESDINLLGKILLFPIIFEIAIILGILDFLFTKRG